MPLQDLFGSLGSIAGGAAGDILDSAGLSSLADAVDAASQEASLGVISDMAANKAGQISELAGAPEGVDLASLSDNAAIADSLGALGIDNLIDAVPNVSEGGIGGFLGGLFGR